MAQRKDIRRPKQPEDPRVSEVMKLFLAELGKQDCRDVLVDVTPEMTDEEEEMALFEGYLKEGYPEAAAAKKAKECCQIVRELQTRSGTRETRRK